MLDKLREKYNKVIESPEFLKWKKDHLEAFLSGTFLQEDWQFDFYDSNKEVVGSFYMGSVTEDRMFKKPDAKVYVLELEKIKVDLNEIDKIIKDSLEKKGEREQNRIVILQNNEGRNVWNITIISSLFNIINFKIDAVNGELISESHNTPLSFRS